MASPAFAHLPGTRLPARPFVIPAGEDARFCAIVGDTPACDGTAHPLWGFLLSRRAIGLDLHELLALADFAVVDGPLLGAFDLVLEAPLRVGHAYDSEIEITGIERKHGRRAGPFDVMVVAHRYTDDGGAAAGRYTQEYVLPRRRS